MASSTRSQPRQQMEVRSQFHAPAPLLQEKNRAILSIGSWLDHRVGLNGLDKATISVTVFRLTFMKRNGHVEDMGV